MKPHRRPLLQTDHDYRQGNEQLFALFNSIKLHVKFKNLATLMTAMSLDPRSPHDINEGISRGACVVFFLSPVHTAHLGVKELQTATAVYLVYRYNFSSCRIDRKSSSSPDMKRRYQERVYCSGRRAVDALRSALEG